MSREIQIGDKVEVCHKEMEVVNVKVSEVTLEGELGDVHGNRIVATKQFARKNLIE